MNMDVISRRQSKKHSETARRRQLSDSHQPLSHLFCYKARKNDGFTIGKTWKDSSPQKAAVFPCTNLLKLCDFNDNFVAPLSIVIALTRWSVLMSSSVLCLRMALVRPGLWQYDLARSSSCWSLHQWNRHLNLLRTQHPMASTAHMWPKRATSSAQNTNHNIYNSH